MDIERITGQLLTGGSIVTVSRLPIINVDDAIFSTTTIQSHPDLQTIQIKGGEGVNLQNLFL